ncbi:hypothetical protein ACTA71_000194 [Dictyostelium dimigraforme]
MVVKSVSYCDFCQRNKVKGAKKEFKPIEDEEEYDRVMKKKIKKGHSKYSTTHSVDEELNSTTHSVDEELNSTTHSVDKELNSTTHSIDVGDSNLIQPDDGDSNLTIPHQEEVSLTQHD